MSKRMHEETDEHDWTLADTSPLEYLVRPQSLSEFQKEVWEKTAKLYKAQPERKVLFPRLACLKDLYSLLKEGVQLNFGVDLNAARYVNGKRETQNPEITSLETVRAAYKEGCTLQWHQPQRWNKDLWRLIAAMENQLQCLVGANAYITPAGTQGLAPHYDDVNLWVCQIEGRKRWRIYKDRTGYSLPAVSSNDFDQGVLGDPVLDVTLEVGDVLFMPRGTVHQAVAQHGDSCHVTISTYQRWALADFTVALIQALQQGQPATAVNSDTKALPPSLRPGLPMGFLKSAGYQNHALAISSGRNFVQDAVAESVATALHAFADQISEDLELTRIAGDYMALDFMASRAPPHPAQIPDKGPAPSISSEVICKCSGMVRLVPCQPSEEVLDAYPEETHFVKIVTSLNNSIVTHMMPGVPSEEAAFDDDEEEDGKQPGGNKVDKQSLINIVSALRDPDAEGEDEGMSEIEDDDEESEDEEDDSGGELVFPGSYSKAIAQLLSKTIPTAVKDIRLRSKDDKLGLAYSLWEEGLISTVSSSFAEKRMRV